VDEREMIPKEEVRESFEKAKEADRFFTVGDKRGENRMDKELKAMTDEELVDFVAVNVRIIKDLTARKHPHDVHDDNLQKAHDEATRRGKAGLYAQGYYKKDDRARSLKVKDPHTIKEPMFGKPMLEGFMQYFPTLENMNFHTPEIELYGKLMAEPFKYEGLKVDLE
jgi:hypothetical protein